MESETGQSGAPVAGAYRGRLAPSPTGYLHLGHAGTFDVARRRAAERGGVLVLRNDDLDHSRCREIYVAAMYEDLRWLGFRWGEGPDVGGPWGPYEQSRRASSYRAAWERLRREGWLYPCRCSRRDVRRNLSAPHEGTGEPVYPGTCRPPAGVAAGDPPAGREVCWRFRVPDGASVRVDDRNLGLRLFRAGKDFGDFVVWRRDGIPSYHLAAVVDDFAMKITEAVRGADLLLSTARQILLFDALGWTPPDYFHCPLVRDEEGRRLAKRDGALGIRALREQGFSPEAVLAMARERAAPAQADR